ncbi:MAG: DUF928 domain-containing protein, partial [Symploca sp. SIO2B6]|nr:DUF928 domain-containing protein [Symploca sp. SIO2B6]
MAWLPGGVGAHAIASTHDEVAINSSVELPQVTFVPPTDQQPNTEGAGSRGDCQQTNAIAHQSIAALLPAESYYGLTAKSHPVFLLQLTNIQAEVLTFTINNEKGENVYETSVPVEQGTGIVRVEMPEHAPSLEVDHLYEWGIIVPCSGQIRPDSPFVSGWVRRTDEPTLMLGTDHYPYPSVEMANQYGQAGIW